MIARVAGILSLVCSASALAFTVGCGAAGGDPSSSTNEKTATTMSELVVGNPTPPPTFPDGIYPWNCESVDPITGAFIANRETEVFGAYATTTSAGDPYTTQFTHIYDYNACQTNDLRCQHINDLFAIPKANGFKYLVRKLVLNQGLKYYIPTGQDFEMIGVQRVDYSWWYEPWNYEGVTTPPWQQIDGNSHPPYGSDGKSADWLQLWNVVYTYQAGGPNGSYPRNNVETTLHTCVTILPMGGTPGNPQPVSMTQPPIDFFVAADDFDPIGHPW
jgi:hypothetical protein